MSKIIIIDLDKTEISNPLLDFYLKLLNNSEDLDPKINKLVDENFWELI